MVWYRYLPNLPYQNPFSKLFQASPQLPGGHMAVTSWVGRLKVGDDAVLAGTVSNGGSALAKRQCPYARFIGY